jgi:hypothetical protein
MELQTTLVNNRIDDLRQTAAEVHATPAPKADSGSGSALGGLRRGLGLRLIGLGKALADQTHGSNAGTAPRMA